ncbi:phosphoadenylyl-sulfate reductase [Shewanella schlegeliana]|uniref:Phosphoadenosine 5'-phosphosulfate reductase n=1 Tax=Shewanella schlegeliana TaxID=190308 RepID=A0ABS1SVW8_9GAMM|nr:phosphoadenylyl-sulfate reductase [Shewanella schlegeliana]MBL4912688.1 phosphoadenylyl-sulfate reductase [Shewanella schlegeliana]MCL1109802.1 phosphoadenylyl-sulfate reductase [Shewanella schlegeliana]GIU30235.1 phosphoadenosine phosphosulfate reductase [Shewanella schlegeliana]
MANTVGSVISAAALKALLSAPKVEQQAELVRVNDFLAKLTPSERVRWALEYLPGKHALSSSFGIQAAVMLHMVSSEKADIPVLLTDTGYLFSETYQFIDELTARLKLNLKVYSSPFSAAWQEARFGKLWEQDLDGLDRYNQINKVEPMQRALAEQEVGTWFAGLRRSQSSTREALPILAIHGERYKILPIIDWSNKQVHEYLTEFELPYHPLWEQGYVSVGDTHSTKPLELGMSEEETRFNGLKRECGLHYDI